MSIKKNTGPVFSIFEGRKSYQRRLGEATLRPPPHTIFSFIFYHSIIHQNNTINSRGSPYTKLHGAPKEVPNKKSLIQHMHQGSTPASKINNCYPTINQKRQFGLHVYFDALHDLISTSKSIS